MLKYYKYGKPKHIPLGCRVRRAWGRIRYVAKECFVIAYSDIFVNKTEPTLIESDDKDYDCATLFYNTGFNLLEKPNDND
jgi:hypothetical protein